MKKILLLLVVVLSYAVPVSAQFFQWANSAPGNAAGTGLSAGQTILATTSHFNNSVTLGAQTFTSTGPHNEYLAVHDLGGHILWAKQIISQSPNRHQVEVDKNQHIIVSGTFNDSLQIGSLLFKTTVPNTRAVFVVKFDATGNLLWARSSALTQTLTAVQTAVSTDDSGNIYLAGSYSGTITFGTTSLTASNQSSAFLTKYDTNGSLLWAKGTGATEMESDVSVKAGSHGHVYLAAETTNPSTYSSGIMVAKLDAAGTILWTRTASSFTGNMGLSVAADNTGNVYLTGKYTNIMVFNNSSANLSISSGGSHKIFLAKLNAAGTWKWAKNAASGTYTAINAYLFFSPANSLAISGTYQGFPQFTSSPLSTFNSLNSFIANFDTAGTANWANNVIGESRNTGITGDANGNFYMAGTSADSLNFSGTMLYTQPGKLRNYLAKVIKGGSSISGTIFMDRNNNGIKDPQETGLRHYLLQTLPNLYYGISGDSGFYNMYLPNGNYSVELPNIPLYHTVSPASHTITINGQNQTQTGKDFAIIPIPNSNDVRVRITSFNPARPGFTFRCHLSFTNVGTTTLSDSLSFAYNNPAIYDSASVIPAAIQPGRLTWHYQNLEPLETRNIVVNFTIPATTFLGTPITGFASIKPFTSDLFQADNQDTLRLIVTGSYDPNDKQVDKEVLSPAVAAAGDYLDYTIRFQNTGTDTAFTVIITDKISTQLTLAKFEMISASHPYKLSLADNNTLEWRFNNILLPDSNRNEPGSHGFVRFRIKSKPGLVLGDSIANNAAIYFDYNAPIITNYAVTKVANPLSIKEPKAGLQPFQLYPNPAQNYVMVAAELKKPTAATVRLVNILGKTISEVTLPANSQLHYQLPLNNLPKGVYIVQLETEHGRQALRLVVQ